MQLHVLAYVNEDERNRNQGGNDNSVHILARDGEGSLVTSSQTSSPRDWREGTDSARATVKRGGLERMEATFSGVVVTENKMIYSFARFRSWRLLW